MVDVDTLTEDPEMWCEKHYHHSSRLSVPNLNRMHDWAELGMVLMQQFNVTLMIKEEQR